MTPQFWVSTESTIRCHYSYCCILTFDPAKNAIQSDAPEGSDTFQWQLMRGKSRRWAQLIIWDKVKVPLQSDAPEESDLWTAWQLFPLDEDQKCHSKDWVGDWVCVELLYNSVKTVRDQLELQTRGGRKSHARPMGPLGPLMSWGPRENCW